jgi:Terminase small subunit
MVKCQTSPKNVLTGRLKVAHYHNFFPHFLKIELMNDNTENKGELKQRPMTTKEYLFCDGILAGKSQRDAYTDAGYVCKDDNVVDASASRLLSYAKIASYLSKKRGEIEKKTDISREWSMSMLKEIAEDAKIDGKLRDSTAAIAEINRMQGYNAPVKIDHTAHVDTFDPAKLPLDVVVELSKLIKKIETLQTVSEDHSEQAGIEKIKIGQ